MNKSNVCRLCVAIIAILNRAKGTIQMHVRKLPLEAVLHTYRSANWMRVAMVALVAVIGSLLATVGPAAANQHTAPPMPERTTSQSACVGDALYEYGFIDIDTLDDGRQDAINCLAYYGITVGKTADTYDPASNVTRSQMALFLYRTAEAAGIDIDAATERTAMFSDIGELGDAWQTAIKALYAHNIMDGRRDSRSGIAGVASSETFVPHEAISRAEMAHYLRNLVRAAQPDMFKDGKLDSVSSLDHFQDAATGTPSAVNDAIAEAYELGITNGVTEMPRAFNPSGLVTRSQMALFITRTLAHTTARPVGLTVQQDGATLVVSVRGRDYQPTDEALRVDAFYINADDADDAFERGGGCDTSEVSSDELEGRYPCEIDRRDPRLVDGDATIDFTDALSSEGIAVWVWVGELGDEYADAADDDVWEHVFKGGTLPQPEASELTVTYEGVDTNDKGEPLTARSGDIVTVYVQLQGHYERETELEDVHQSVDYTLQLKLERHLKVGDAGYVADGTGTNRRIETLPEATTLTLDEKGRGQFTLSGPRSFHSPTHDYTETFTLMPKEGNSHPIPESRFTAVKFAPADMAVPTTVEISGYDPWIEADDGTAAASERDITVTVYDQFGQLVKADEEVLLVATGAFVDDGTATPTGTTFKKETNSRGEVTFTYIRNRAAGIVTLHAGIDGDTDATPGNDATDDGNDALCVSLSTPKVAADADYRDVCSDKVMVYFASEVTAASAASGLTYNILHVDTDRRRGEKIIVQNAADNTANPMFVDYSDVRESQLFTDDYDHDDTLSEQRRAWDAAIEMANKQAAKAEGYCMLTWATPPRPRWVEIDCPEMMT